MGEKTVFEQVVSALLTLLAVVLCVLEEDFLEMSAPIIKIGPKQAWEVKGWISSLREENADMQVTKLMPADKNMASATEQITGEQLQNEFNYIQAERITKKLLDKGLISDVEYHKIMEANRRSFSPSLAPLL